MHGLRNDFIVFDARNRPLALSAKEAVALADRRTGIGCDTIVVLEPPGDRDAEVSARFINADGGPSTTCGNATRCVGQLMLTETGKDRVRIATAGGVREVWRAAGGIAVDMGTPKLDWADIPLKEATDTLNLSVAHYLATPELADGIGLGVGVGMGNPHVVFFVADPGAVDIATLGPAIERAALFPERTNVEFATVEAPSRIRMRVWERGIGITPACGSGACATLVAAVRRGLSDRKAILLLDGGPLDVAWRDDDHVIMTGPTKTSFTGVIGDDLLPGRARFAPG